MKRDLLRLLAVLIAVAVLLVVLTWIKVRVGAETFATGATITIAVVAAVGALTTVIVLRRDRNKEN